QEPDADECGQEAREDGGIAAEVVEGEFCRLKRCDAYPTRRSNQHAQVNLATTAPARERQGEGVGGALPGIVGHAGLPREPKLERRPSFNAFAGSHKRAWGPRI